VFTHFILIRNSDPAELQVTRNLIASEIYMHGLVWVGKHLSIK